ncbi:MAG: hypothetical protein LBF16_04145, partial [Pseudomonadales bacterium]|nr:hypothetical protein [Pseudomonadales bacterium]
MRQSVIHTLCAVLLLAMASPSFALVSLCSGEFLPEVGADGLRHEVFWNDFDAWFTDAGVEVYTAV